MLSLVGILIKTKMGKDKDTYKCIVVIISVRKSAVKYVDMTEINDFFIPVCGRKRN